MVKHLYANRKRQRCAKFCSNFPPFSYQHCQGCLLVHAKMLGMDMVSHEQLELLQSVND